MNKSRLEQIKRDAMLIESFEDLPDLVRALANKIKQTAKELEA